MTQLRKGTAERTGLIRGAGEARGPRGIPRETDNNADTPLREAREKAEIERLPGGKPPSAGAGSTPDDSLIQNPPKPGNEDADKTTGRSRRPDGGPLDPASSFVPGAVLPSSVRNASPNLKKKLNDLPADDPERAKIPPELKI